MSAHVLFKLLSELGKRDKMRGLPSILSLFRGEFKETRSVTMNIFQKKIFFYIICKKRIMLCFHNKYVQYS